MPAWLTQQRRSYSVLPLKYTLWTRAVGAHLVGKYVLYSYCKCSRLKSSMPFKHDLALRNIPPSKQPCKTQPQFENKDITWSPQYHYRALSSTLTTNCFASMFKRKSDKCMMNRDDHLRHFSETLTNRHQMSIVKNSCICDKWLCMTCSNNRIRTMIYVKKIAHLTEVCT